MTWCKKARIAAVAEKRMAGCVLVPNSARCIEHLYR